MRIVNSSPEDRVVLDRKERRVLGCSRETTLALGSSACLGAISRLNAQYKRAEEWQPCDSTSILAARSARNHAERSLDVAYDVAGEILAHEARQYLDKREEAGLEPFDWDPDDLWPRRQA